MPRWSSGSGRNGRGLITPVFVRGGPVSSRRCEGLFANGAEAPVERAEANDVKLLMYTSGTTGPAKGVLHTHNTLGAEIRNFIRHLAPRRTDLSC